MAPDRPGIQARIAALIERSRVLHERSIAAREAAVVASTEAKQLVDTSCATVVYLAENRKFRHDRLAPATAYKG